MKKKVLSIFLALAMMLCLVPTVALAEGNTGTTTVNLSVPEATYELVIPSKLNMTSRALSIKVCKFFSVQSNFFWLHTFTESFFYETGYSANNNCS